MALYCTVVRHRIACKGASFFLLPRLSRACAGAGVGFWSGTAWEQVPSSTSQDVSEAPLPSPPSPLNPPPPSLTPSPPASTTPPTSNGTEVLVVFQTKGTAAYSLLIVTVTYPPLSLDPVPYDATPGPSVSAVAVVLSCLIPPLLMIACLIIGLELNGRQKPPLDDASSSGSFESDKG